MSVRSNKETAVEFLTLVAAGKVREAYEGRVAREFKHHNPYFRGDVASLREAMERDAAEYPGKLLEVKISLQEGDKVVLFSHMRRKMKDAGFAFVHIFRFEDGRIAEVWDVGQAIPEDSPNEHGTF